MRSDLNILKKVFDVNSVEQGSDANICSLHTLEINWNSCTKDDFLNSDISPKDVTEAIHHLKANKAAGPDGIIPEAYKHAGDKIIPFLVHLLNTIFTSGEYPEAWTETIIQPLHRKGSIHEPDNYRGISLLDVCSKLYNHIIDKRLSRWTEDHDALRDSSRFSQRPLNYRPYFYIVFYDSETAAKE